MSIAKYRAVGAAITKMTGKESCAFTAVLESAHQPDMTDERRWIAFDAQQTPSRASWENALFDDRGIDEDGKPIPTELNPADLDGIGITSIGPLDEMPRAQTFGAIYLRDDQFRANWNKILDANHPDMSWKPAGWFNYELTSVAYPDDAEQKRRYVGLHARVTNVGTSENGHRVGIIDVLPTTDRTTPVATIGIDFDDPDHCELKIDADLVDLNDPNSGKETMLEPKVDSIGGIYLNLRFVAKLQVRGPKLPIGEGL